MFYVRDESFLDMSSIINQRVIHCNKLSGSLVLTNLLYEELENGRYSSYEVVNQVEAYVEWQDIDKFAHVASFDEIKENDFNLNIPRYVDTFEEEVIPLTQIVSDINTCKKDIENVTDELYGMLDELVGTTPEADV